MALAKATRDKLISAGTARIAAALAKHGLRRQSLAGLQPLSPFQDALAGEPEMVLTPSESGKGQKIWRCPTCRIGVWSNYPGAGDAVRFVRVGTLDNPDALPPDIHIFTMSKQPWVVLPEGTPAVPEFYDIKKMWPAESQERRKAMRRG